MFEAIVIIIGLLVQAPSSLPTASGHNDEKKEKALAGGNG
jgi:hypothetical protein